ncbi:MAG: hypothetical protein A4E73_00107 [Syntrophaceae bacterium PtaU1.Bin231]|nr:MAG: hypothetical protein A4E73_00107 [Syntrophaceae bacterium PtaU1.Bin231]
MPIRKPVDDDLRRGQGRLGGRYDIGRPGQEEDFGKDCLERPVNAGVAARERRRPEVFRRAQAQRQNPARLQFRGAQGEKVPGVKTVGLAGRRLRHPHEDEIVGSAFEQETPRIGGNDTDIRFPERPDNVVRQVPHRKLKQDGIQFNVVDLCGFVFCRFTDESLAAAPEDQDGLRLRVLEGRRMAEGFRLGSLRLEGQGIVFKD